MKVSTRSSILILALVSLVTSAHAQLFGQEAESIWAKIPGLRALIPRPDPAEETYRLIWSTVLGSCGVSGGTNVLGPDFSPAQVYLEVVEHWSNGRPLATPLTSKQIRSHQSRLRDVICSAVAEKPESLACLRHDQEQASRELAVIPADHPHREHLLGYQELYRVVGIELARHESAPSD